ncbi:MAG TPA: DUF1398 family protein [Rhizomicrobium sp.]|jgi:uncharacterized protein YbcV (DUF1398 family)|nr:DUF1398 family protein [Rhizomicrobium sp.]
MNANVKAVIEECTRESDAERITFGQVVMKLIEAGVERYHADLVRSEKIYYMPDGENVSLPCHAVKTVPAREFSAAGVDAAVRAIQTGKIQYREFCERIAASGCAGYLVSLAGRRAVYYGRTGEMHVEMFPGAK